MLDAVEKELFDIYYGHAAKLNIPTPSSDNIPSAILSMTALLLVVVLLG